jgi:hypothetical protein
MDSDTRIVTILSVAGIGGIYWIYRKIQVIVDGILKRRIRALLRRGLGSAGEREGDKRAWDGFLSEQSGLALGNALERARQSIASADGAFAAKDQAPLVRIGRAAVVADWTSRPTLRLFGSRPRALRRHCATLPGTAAYRCIALTILHDPSA